MNETQKALNICRRQPGPSAQHTSWRGEKKESGVVSAGARGVGVRRCRWKRLPPPFSLGEHSVTPERQVGFRDEIPRQGPEGQGSARHLRQGAVTECQGKAGQHEPTTRCRALQGKASPGSRHPGREAHGRDGKCKTRQNGAKPGHARHVGNVPHVVASLLSLHVIACIAPRKDIYGTSGLTGVKPSAPATRQRPASAQTKAARGMEAFRSRAAASCIASSVRKRRANAWFTSKCSACWK